MNPGRLIARIKSTLLEHEAHYSQQEQMIQDGLNTGFENRWKHARNFLRGTRNKSHFAAHSSAATALSVATLTSFLWADCPEDALFRLIYRYPSGIDRKLQFQHNFAWLLLMRLIEDVLEDQVLLPMEPDVDIPEIEILQSLLSALHGWVIQTLIDDLIQTPVPRHS